MNAASFSDNIVTSGVTNGGSGNEDGFGNFNLRVDSGSGFSPGGVETTVQIDLTNTAGTWASVLDVLDTNNKGYEVAAHVGPSTDGTYSGVVTTGYVSNGPVSVPEPSTLIFLGLSLFGLAVFGKKVKDQI